MHKLRIVVIGIIIFHLHSCGSTKPDIPVGYDIATLGSGCFWCGEAVFQRLEGVVKVESGFSGGLVPFPSSKVVIRGGTEHAEVVQITFDPKIISYKELLQIFFSTHDPTTLNRQGEDIGDQYRSVIFYHNDNQEQIAEQTIHEIDSAKIWDNPIVTKISPYIEFYKAEEHNQNYYNENSNQPYCKVVINPKLSKLRKEFSNKLKK